MSLEQVLSGMGSSNEDEYNKLRQEIIREMVNANNIELKTELNDTQIEACISLKFQQTYINDVFGVNLPYKELVRDFMKDQVSRKREGRKEYVEMMKSYILDVFGQNTLARKLIGR